MKKTLGLLALCVYTAFAVGCGSQTDGGASSAGQSQQQRPSGTVLLDINTQDGKTPTTVGHVVAGKGLESTGTGGQLMFGPYSGMSAGDYVVTFYGEFEGTQPDKPLSLDVAYGQGASIAKSLNVQAADAKNGILGSFEFHLPTPVSDLEVRAKVANGAHVIVKGYKVAVK
jgi:hypothetical protein